MVTSNHLTLNKSNVKKSGGIDYAIKVMNDYYKKAQVILETLPESVYKESLSQLIQFTIERSK